MPKENTFYHWSLGTFVLTVAAFIVKVLSVVYRVPFQNIVGDVGFYIYQQIYPIYGLAAVLALSGFPVILSKLVVQYRDQTEFRSIMQAAFTVLMIAGFLLFCSFFYGAPWIAHWMGDEDLGSLIRFASFSFILLPFISVWRGFYQGYGNMLPTAISQIIEQLIRVLVILLVSLYLVKHQYSLYTVGNAPVLGSLLGGVACIAVLFYYAGKNRHFHLLYGFDLTMKRVYEIGKVILIQGFAICVTGLLLIYYQLIDSLNVYSLLTQSGMDSIQAQILKGVYDRGWPLLQLGAVAASSLALVLVPFITTAWFDQKNEQIRQHAATAIKFSVVIGAGAALGLVNVIRPTNIMLFKNANGSMVLAILSLSIFFISILLTCSSILQGIGDLFSPVKYIFIGLMFKLIGNYLLVPLLGTYGAACATLIGLFISVVLLFNHFLRKVKVDVEYKKLAIKVVMALFIMTICIQLWHFLFNWAGFSGRLWNTMIALSSVCIGGAIYIFFILRSGLFNEQEVRFFPLGNRFQRMIRKVK